MGDNIWWLLDRLCHQAPEGNCWQPASKYLWYDNCHYNLKSVCIKITPVCAPPPKFFFVLFTAISFWEWGTMSPTITPVKMSFLLPIRAGSLQQPLQEAWWPLGRPCPDQRKCLARLSRIPDVSSCYPPLIMLGTKGLILLNGPLSALHPARPEKNQVSSSTACFNSHPRSSESSG